MIAKSKRTAHTLVPVFKGLIKASEDGRRLKVEIYFRTAAARAISVSPCASRISAD